MRSVFEKKLAKRTIEELKTDAVVAMTSEGEYSGLAFVLILNTLEERLTTKEYAIFEDSLAA